MPRAGTLRGEYASDIEGGAPVRTRYEISGRINVPDYLDFVAERAAWLNIGGWAAASSEHSVTLVASGPEALVGAFEMACTLGPLNALVETIEATAETPSPAAGFVVRSSPESPASRQSPAGSAPGAARD